MQTIQIFEQGSCRGDDFENVSSITLNELETLQFAISNGEDGYDLILDFIHDSYPMNLPLENALLSIVSNNYTDDESKLVELISAMKEDNTLHIETEESDIGFGRSLAKAKMALVGISKDDEDEDW